MTFIKQAAISVVLLVSLVVPAQAIQKVASRFGVIEVRFGYAMPLGEYDGLPGRDFVFTDSVTGSELVSFDAERVFQDGFAVGISYGQMVGSNWRATFGFDYARNEVKNPIIEQIGDYQYTYKFTDTDDVSYNQYGLSLRVAFAPTDLRRRGWSPFVGLGAMAGLSALQSAGYTTESEFDFGLSLDFGFDMKLWENPDARSFVALSSINSWNFVATGERVSHLQIGGGIKYFFKP